ncbi:MAG: sigma 54-interacting transcriptional regulator [Firmicutes bacterium]|nr:sigma 54-interacting transcriptional regulator [Bacillota bacterium]
MLRCLDLVLNSVDYIAVIDNNFNIVFNTRYETQVNDTAQQVNRREYINKKYYEVYPYLDLEKSTIMRAITTGEIVVGKNQTVIDFKGRELCTDNITIPIIRRGRTMGAVELARDVTTVDLKTNEDLRKNEEFDALIDKLKTLRGQITFDTILTKNDRMRHTIDYARTLAVLPNHTLIYGETGTGKELFAQAMIKESGIPSSHVVTENCAAIPANLFESTLFGATKGAYTGAENKKGLLEEADGGILFLDELNAMPYEVQGKLLRVMQEGTFRKLGSNVEKKVDVKIIATMNVDPQDAIEKRILRRDLFYRFSSSVIHVPSLAERPEDVEFYLDYFLEEYCKIYGKKISGYGDDLRELLRDYTWDGNVRELKHLVEAMVATSNSATLDVRDMPDYVYQRVMKAPGAYEAETLDPIYQAADFSNGKNIDMQKYLADQERDLITAALRHAGGNRTKASRLLSIPRPTLIYRMEKLGIE